MFNEFIEGFENKILDYSSRNIYYLNDDNRAFAEAIRNIYIKTSLMQNKNVAIVLPYYFSKKLISTIADSIDKKLIKKMNEYNLELKNGARLILVSSPNNLRGYKIDTVIVNYYTFQCSEIPEISTCCKEVIALKYG